MRVPAPTATLGSALPASQAAKAASAAPGARANRSGATRGSRLGKTLMDSAPAKRSRQNGGMAARASAAGDLRQGSSFAVSGLYLTDHTITVPLDHSGATPGTIDVFFREVVQLSKKGDATLPYLLFLQGGPGFEAPRPTDCSGWLKQATNYFRVVLLDQRGTGRSTPVTTDGLVAMGPPETQAAYLRHFRSDAIVYDAELIRTALVPSSNQGGRWSVLGQSFGGFCCLTYLSFAPGGLTEVLMTGGIPPGIASPCSAEDVYRACVPRCIAQTHKFYERFPDDVARVQALVLHLESLPGGAALTPGGNRLTPRALQALGLHALGFSAGLERLHYLLEGALEGGQLSYKFKKEFDTWISWDTNPLYALLHEPIYCQAGGASRWAAQRVRDAHAAEFDASAAAREGRPVLFTGEMVFPWMFEDYAELRKVAGAAHALAETADWGPLYDAAALSTNAVPTAAISYYEDLFVDFNLAQETAGRVRGLRQWVTNEYLHCGIREAGAAIFERLLSMARGAVMLR